MVRILYSLRLSATVMALLCAMRTGVRADDTTNPDEASPEGTWQWSFLREGKPAELAVKIKEDEDGDGVVEGTFVARDGKELPIKEGTFKDGELSFVITREFKGRDLAVRYSGIIVADKIRGHMEVDVLGKALERDWEAKRLAGTHGELNGNWKFVLESQLGRVERMIKIKQEGEKLTGTCSYEQGEAPLKDGKVKGSEISFVVAYERDGKPARFSYKGELKGRSLKGTVSYEIGGETGKLEFTGERTRRVVAEK